MANKVTGSTDITGAISVRPRTERSVLIVCENTSSDDDKADANVMYSIYGTADANTKFGATVMGLVKVLINNGVDNIKCICVGEYGTDGGYETAADAYEAAFEESLNDNSIRCVILDVTTSAIISKLKAHLTNAENEDMFRYGVVGLTATTTTAAITEAATINDKRVFAVFPRFVDASNTVLSGIYGAAGLAALIMSETYSDPALPMNGVAFNGFGGTEIVLKKSDRDALEQAGIVAVVGGSSPEIWRLVTTRTKDGSGTDDPTWHEGSTLFIADDVLETMILTLQSTYKRTKNVARILDAIKTTVIGILEEKEGFEIIENFDKNTVSVVKDPSDNYGALVDYEIDVVTPLYTITITQHMKL